MSTLDEQNKIEVDDLNLLLFEEEDEEFLQLTPDPMIEIENVTSIEEDRPIEFLDERFSLDKELRLSGEQRLKLEVIRSLREPCDRLTYGKRLKEAAKKLGKSERTVRRLVKAWQEEGLAALNPGARADKGQPRKSEYWYNLAVKIYKGGNKGSDRKTRSQTAETIRTKAYELAKRELQDEIDRLMDQGLRGEDLDWKIQELIESREKAGGFAFWVQYGQPPSTRTVERWLKPIEERQYQAKTSRSPGWHGSAGGVLRTRDGRELRYEHSNDVWQIDHTKADILLVDEDGEEIGRPYLTTVIDCYSRCIVGFRLGLSAPSSQVVALALRHAILPKRYGAEHELRSKWSAYGVPKYIYTDGGRDFRSSHLVEWIADQLGFEMILRSHPSEGGIVERPFRTFSGLLSEMPGYTGSNVKDRPEGAEGKACISLPELEKLIVGYIVDSYNQRPDARSQANPLTPKQSRIERWQMGLRMAPTLLKERELDICLMKATERVVYDNGYLNFAGLRYKGENLGGFAGQRILLRFDPRDITMVLVYSRQDNLEKFLARAYAVGLEAERLSLEEIKHARKKAEKSGKGINNISIMEEAIRRRNFLKQKTSKSKAERRKAEQERVEAKPQRLEDETVERKEKVSAQLELETEPIEKLNLRSLREELGL
jgi:putative transposase